MKDVAKKTNQGTSSDGVRKALQIQRLSQISGSRAKQSMKPAQNRRHAVANHLIVEPVPGVIQHVVVGRDDAGHRLAQHRDVVAFLRHIAVDAVREMPGEDARCTALGDR